MNSLKDNVQPNGVVA